MALAQTAPSSNAPTLHEAVEAAWQQRQAAQPSHDRVRRAQASVLAARSWLPEAPALEINERSDRWRANKGTNEREIAVRLPLWLPGQRAARAAAADADLAWAEATQAADKLKLAGEVRERAWDVVAAQAQLRQAESQTESAKVLAEDAARRVKAGELARADLLELQAEVLAAEAQLHDARAKLATAHAQWTALTGLAAVPAAAEEVQPGVVAHPALRAAELALARASRALDDVQRSSRDAPELGIGLRQDRDLRGQPREATVVLGLRWPFATDARNEPKRAAALGDLEAARVDAATQQQQLGAERVSAIASLSAAEAQLAAARQRADLMQQRAALLDAAAKAGEVGLPERVRARSAAGIAAAALVQQQAAVGLARARLNQTLGVLP